MKKPINIYNVVFLILSFIVQFQAQSQELVQEMAQKRDSLLNEVTVAYQIDVFDKMFKAQHLEHILYKHQFKNITILPQVSIAQRFDKTDLISELSVYAKFPKKQYVYFNVGFSNRETILFPLLKLGAQYHFLVKEKWELSPGLRYLNFDSIHVIIGVFSINRYFNNNGLMLRFFYELNNTASFPTTSLSWTRNFNKDFISVLSATRGVSPDSQYGITTTYSNKDMVSYSFNLRLSKKINNRYVVSISSSLSIEELARDRGNYVKRTGLGINFSHLF